MLGLGGGLMLKTDAQIGIRVTGELKKRLELQAQRESRSVSNLIIKVISEYLDQTPCHCEGACARGNPSHPRTVGADAHIGPLLQARRGDSRIARLPCSWNWSAPRINRSGARFSSCKKANIVAVKVEKASDGGRAIHESPLQVPSAVRGMAVRAAFPAPVEPQLLSSLGGKIAAGAAALFASSARSNRAMSAYRFYGPPEPHRRWAPGPGPKTWLFLPGVLCKQRTPPPEAGPPKKGNGLPRRPRGASSQ